MEETHRVPEYGITYITVLDFDDMRVCQYKVDKWIHQAILDNGMEDFLAEKDHNVSNCEWMWHQGYGICRDFDPII